MATVPNIFAGQNEPKLVDLDTNFASLGSMANQDSTGVNIDGGTINGSLAVGGTWTAAATLTLPAYTLGGTVALNSKTLSGNATFTEQLTLTNASNYNIYASGAGANYFAGSVGVGNTTSSQKLLVGGTATGSNVTGISSAQQIQSDLVSSFVGVNSSNSTQAAAFTINQVIRFNAAQGTIGAGSAITSQIGYLADSTLTGATNNFGFYGNIALGTGRYNFYAAGTAANYFAGNLYLGAIPGAGYSFLNQLAITGATTAVANYTTSTVKSDVTGAAYGYRSEPSTEAASFTLGALTYYYASQGTIGAGSAVTTQYGFRVSSNLTGATNNYGFFSDIASGTGRWNFYAAGTADNYFAGSVGIGSTNTAGYSLRVGKALTGAVNTYGVASEAQVQSDVTTATSMFLSYPSTQASAFTLPTLIGYQAGQGTFGAGSTVTTQYGFIASSNITGATNNYGFYSNLPSGTGRYNFYAGGTADNYFAGSVGIGITSLTGYNLYINKNITGAISAYGMRNYGVVQSDVTSSANVYFGSAATQATSFTLNSINIYRAAGGTVGAGSTVTNQYAFICDSDFTGATTNTAFLAADIGGANATSGKTMYGFRSALTTASGGGTAWNLYISGTAANYFAGDLTIYGGTAIPAGGTAGSGYKFSSTSNFGVFFGSGVPTLSAAKGSLYLRSDGTTTNDRMYVNTNGSTTWTAVTTAA